MSKLRSVSTSFWSDPFIEDLTPNQKLLFLYLITNDKTNMLGIYEVSTRKISFETGIGKDDITEGLNEFERLGKVKYIGNYVILINYMKHQNFNTNMKKSAIDIYNSLPNKLKHSKLSVSKDNPLEGFESLLDLYGMVSKVEYEVEGEGKDEIEVKTKIPTEEEFLAYAVSNISNINKLDVRLKYRAWKEGGWKTGGDKPKHIKNWKTTLLNTIPHMRRTQKQPIG